MLFFGSIIALTLGAATLFLQVYSLKGRNPFFEAASKRILLLSFCIVFIPSILLFYIQEDYGKLVIAAEKAKEEKLVEESRYVSSITLRWKPGIATDHSQLALINDVVKGRLKRANRTHLTVTGNFDRTSAYTTIRSTSPNGFDRSKLHLIINDAVTPTLKFQPYQHVASFPSVENYDEILSVRSLHPGQDRIALSGYPDAPEGYTRMPWQDGFVYVSESYHINDSSIYNATRYQDNGILLTLTPEGLNRMQAMAYRLSQMQMKVAVIYKGKVRGVYEPQICVTDQLVINDIPETPQQIDLDADLLSQPRGYIDVESTDLGFSHHSVDIKPHFPQSLYMTLASDRYDKLWVVVYCGLLITVSLLLFLLHLKTKPDVPKERF